MGMIKNARTGQERLLAECTVVGRAPSCDIRLRTAQVSAEHAAIRWASGRWRLVDLSSRNGTWSGAGRLASGESTELDSGARLCFGAPAEEWMLASDEPPVAFVRSSEHERPIELGLLALPSPDDPQLVLAQMNDGSWVVEDDLGRRPAEDREVLHVAGRRWRVYLSPLLPRTVTAAEAPAALSEAQLIIRHDQTEEHVTAEIRPAVGARVDLGARAHNAIVLELARVRLEDRKRGVAEAEEGWIHSDELSKRLRLEVNHVNIMIYRLRRQLAEKGVADGASVIERRARSGLLRVGPRAVTVARIG